MLYKRTAVQYIFGIKRLSVRMKSCIGQISWNNINNANIFVRGVYRVLVGKREGKRPLGRPRRR